MSDNSNEKKDEKKEPEKPVEENDGKSYEYELIGVTVHTGTADGGHYYAFIRDRYVVYERNHYFGFGPIPKPKLADTFSLYRK